MDAAQDLGIPVHYIPSLGRSISPAKDYRAYREIVDILREVKPDLVHCHSSKAGILGRLAAHRLGIKNIFTAHGWAFAEGTPRSRKIIAILPERLLSHWCDRIITVSETDRRLALRYGVGTPEKLVTIHNGISDTSYVKNSASMQSPVTIIMVARFAPPKDFGMLLEAASGIDGNIHLQLVGDGPQMNENMERAAALGMTENTEFTGSRDDVDELLAAADIFVLASDWEGLPISILEAMRAGLPVVASNVGGIHEAVSDGVSGILVARGDAPALARALTDLIKDTDKRTAMGREARTRFEHSFNTNVMLSRTASQYTKVGIRAY
jgi:glycosyltransferase involved in cell wall biosynthesis